MDALYVEAVRTNARARVRDLRANSESAGVLVDGVVYDTSTESILRLAALMFATTDPAYSAAVMTRDDGATTLTSEQIYRVASTFAVHMQLCARWEARALEAIASATGAEELLAIVDKLDDEAPVGDTAEPVPSEDMVAPPPYSDGVVRDLNAIGVVDAAGITAGTAAIAGDLSARTATIASTLTCRDAIAKSVDASAGTVSCGALTTGTLTATGAAALQMTSITAPSATRSYADNTDLMWKGDPITVTGASVAASGLWNSYARGVGGGDLVLTAGDAVSVGNDGSRASTVNGGDVYIRAGRASNTVGTRGTGFVRTRAGAVYFQSGSLERTNNRDASTYVTEMVLQNGMLGVGVGVDIASRADTLQVAGSLFASGAATVGSLDAGAGSISAETVTVRGSTTTATLVVQQSASIVADLDVCGTASTFKFNGSSNAPTITAGPGAGTNPVLSLSVGSSDAAGQFSIRTTNSTNSSTGTVLCTITFTSAYTTAPFVVLYPSSTSAGSLPNWPIVVSSTTGFQIQASGNTSLAKNTTYSYFYHVIQ